MQLIKVRLRLIAGRWRYQDQEVTASTGTPATGHRRSPGALGDTDMRTRRDVRVRMPGVRDPDGQGAGGSQRAA